ncbi:hypothetical protein [Rufibacter radiotolerans]|nr:hypothetical protein [Rufibacter radiotolerans]
MVKLEVLSSRQKVLLGISLVLYAISLTQVGFSYVYQEQVQSIEGWLLVFMGGMSIAGGGLLEWVIWLANPLYIFSIIFALKNDKNALSTIGIAFLLALDFLFWKEVLAAESGTMGPITSRGVGYFLWLSSIFIWAATLYMQNWKRIVAKLS